MDLGAVPDKLHCMLLFEQVVEREIRDGQLIAHRQFGEGYVEFVLLGERCVLIRLIQVQDELITHFLHFWLFLSEEPSNHIVKRLEVVHDQGIFLINENFVFEKVLEDVPGYLDDVLRVHVRAILQAADDEQEDVPPLLIHLHLINVAAPHVKEASHVLKDLNKDQSELLQGQLNT